MLKIYDKTITRKTIDHGLSERPVGGIGLAVCEWQ